VLRAIGIALAGKAGARLAARLGLPTSATSLLRWVRGSPLPPQVPALQVVGVDEWAWRRGYRYGTILVDLPTHRVVDLRPDRSAETVGAWLAQHPTVTAVCRDRSDLYADEIRRGAPKAVQVVDRFHLVHNLRQALEAFLLDHRPALQTAVCTAMGLTPPTGPVPVTPMYRGRRRSPKPAARQKAAPLPRYATWGAIYEAVQTLRTQGIPVTTIARRLGISRPTVYAYLRRAAEAGQAPEAHTSPYTRSQGPSARAVSFALVCPAAKRSREAQTSVDQLCQGDTGMARAHVLIQAFLTMVRERRGADLEAWRAEAMYSGIEALARCARGLQEDLAAVTAGLTLAWRHGATAGQIHRLQLRKRQGYGRAGFALIRQRVLQAA
jgi:transposase